MSSQIKHECMNCQQNEASFILDCQHLLCVDCFSTTLSPQCNKITCLKCKMLTTVEFSTIHKLKNSHCDRPVPSARSQLVCLDCFDECFTIEQFIGGLHAGHQVKTLKEIYPLISTNIAQMSEKVKDKVDNLYWHCNRLCEQKRMLNDVLICNLAQLRIVFDNLKQQIESKEEQIISAYEQSILEEFQLVEQSLVSTRKSIAEGQMYNDWIENHLTVKQLHASNLITENTDFFFRNRTKIQQFLAVRQAYPYNQYTGYKVQTENAKTIAEAIRKLDFFRAGISEQERSKSKTGKVKIDKQYFENKKRMLREAEDEEGGLLFRETDLSCGSSLQPKTDFVRNRLSDTLGRSYGKSFIR